MSTPTAPSARERILDTASHLFYRHGFVSVGVDTIIAEAGVAKMSLYRHFASKDDPIVAYLEQSNERFWAWFDGAAVDGTPHGQLVHVFDALGTFATSPACFGCMFQLAAADFPDPEHPTTASRSPTRTRCSTASATSPARPDRLTRIRSPDSYCC